MAGPQLCAAFAQCLKGPEPPAALDKTTTSARPAAGSPTAAPPPVLSGAIWQAELPSTFLPTKLEQPSEAVAKSSRATSRNRKPLIAGGSAPCDGNGDESAPFAPSDAPPPVPASVLPSEASAYQAATVAALAAARAAAAAEAIVAKAMRPSGTRASNVRSPAPSARGVAHAAARAAKLAGVRAQTAALNVPPMVRMRGASPQRSRGVSPPPSSRRTWADAVGAKRSDRKHRGDARQHDAIEGEGAQGVDQTDTDSESSISSSNRSQKIEEYRNRWNEKFAR